MLFNQSMFVSNVSLVNAKDYPDNLVGRQIMVDIANHGAWFENAAKGSSLCITDIFEVVSVEHFGNTAYLNFISERRNGPDHSIYGPYDGCGEAHRFYVLVAS